VAPVYFLRLFIEHPKKAQVSDIVDRESVIGAAAGVNA
jgi:hypothetical protein